MTSPTAPTIDFRELLKDALDVYSDEVLALRTWADALDADATAFRERADDLAARADRLRKLLDQTDPSPRGDPNAAS